MVDNEKNQQINYPYLPEGRAIGFVAIENPFMAAAKKYMEEHTTELNHPTGSVVVLGGEIIGRAANKSALKSRKLQELHKNGWCVRRILKIPSGQKYWLCPGCAQLHHHAEARAVRDALNNQKSAGKGSGSIAGANLYLYGHWWCCKPCWDAMIAAGIKDVYVVSGAYGMFK